MTSLRATPTSWRAAGIACLAAAWVGCAAVPPPEIERRPVTPESREQALREAEAWQPIETATLDVRRGPPGARDPDEPLACDFVVPHTAPGGNTPKFLCRDENGRVYKVKYGAENMELYGEVFGSRLLWALGFFSDRIDPVSVQCRGCPEDPWDFLKAIDPANPQPGPTPSTVREFSPAIVETYYGQRIQAYGGQGLPWPALLGVRAPEPERAARQQVHREALTLLAALLGHGDSKSQNQTLACAPGAGEPGDCRASIVYIGDLGAILGRGHRLVVSKVDIEDWESIDVWRDPAACVALFNPHPIGTLFDTPISEPARAFLAERLSALSLAQIRDLFDVAGLDGVGGEVEEDDDGDAHPPRLDDWVRAFEAKRRQIVEHRCP